MKTRRLLVSLAVGFGITVALLGLLSGWLAPARAALPAPNTLQTGNAAAAQNGSAWFSETVDSEGDVGWYTSLALEPTAPFTPHISYKDFTNGDLKHATWGTAPQPEPVGGVTQPASALWVLAGLAALCGFALAGGALVFKKRLA